MEEKAVLMGVDDIDFTTEKGEQIKCIKLHLLQLEEDKEPDPRSIGRHVMMKCTKKMTLADVRDMVGHEVVLKYKKRFGSDKLQFTGIALA